MRQFTFFPELEYFPPFFPMDKILCFPLGITKLNFISFGCHYQFLLVGMSMPLFDLEKAQPPDFMHSSTFFTQFLVIVFEPVRNLFSPTNAENEQLFLLLPHYFKFFPGHNFSSQGVRL